MANIFGVDIAKVVAESIAGAGNLRPGTLTKVTKGTRTAGDLLDGTNPTTTEHTCQCVVETKTKRRKGTLVEEPMSVATIIGASITPTTEPSPTDTLLVDGVTWTLYELISRDPASAVYEFRAES